MSEKFLNLKRVLMPRRSWLLRRRHSQRRTGAKMAISLSNHLIWLLDRLNSWPMPSSTWPRVDDMVLLDETVPVNPHCFVLFIGKCQKYFASFFFVDTWSQAFTKPITCFTRRRFASSRRTRGHRWWHTSVASSFGCSWRTKGATRWTCHYGRAPKEWRRCELW